MMMIGEDMHGDQSRGARADRGVHTPTATQVTKGMHARLGVRSALTVTSDRLAQAGDAMGTPKPSEPESTITTFSCQGRGQGRKTEGHVPAVLVSTCLYVHDLKASCLYQSYGPGFRMSASSIPRATHGGK
jgi:hypothetical protein